MKNLINTKILMPFKVFLPIALLAISLVMTGCKLLEEDNTPTCSGDTSTDLGTVRFEKTDIAVGSLGTPYDVTSDSSGLSSYIPNHGSYTTRPRIQATLDSDCAVNAIYVEGNQTNWGVDDPETEALTIVKIVGDSITASSSVTSLGYLAGVTSDQNGSIFYASATSDSRAQNDIPSSYVEDVIRLYTLDDDFNVMDSADALIADDGNPSWIGYVYNPLIFGTSKLAYNNDHLMLVFAHNGDGHQGEDALPFTVNDLTVTANYRNRRFSPSHSMHQRLIAKDDSFLVGTVGDAYPRSIHLTKFMPNDGYASMDTFHIKGGTGDNNIFGTHFGGIDFVGDTIAIAFSTENSDSLTQSNGAGAGNMDIAIQFINDGGDSLAMASGGDSLTVTSGGSSETSTGIHWLTDYSGTTHGFNPRVKAYKGHFVVTWEEYDSGADSYQGCFLVTDTSGDVTQSKECDSEMRFNRGDDVIADGSGKPLWITGDADSDQLIVQTLTDE